MAGTQAASGKRLDHAAPLVGESRRLSPGPIRPAAVPGRRGSPSRPAMPLRGRKPSRTTRRPPAASNLVEG